MAKPEILTSTDPDFLPVQFDLTEAKLQQLAVDYDPETIPKDIVMGDEHYEYVHNKVMAITKIRTGAEKVRKGLKADSLAWGRMVDAYAKGLNNKLLALEEPWKKVKLDLEAAERKASEAKLAAEQERQARIEKSIGDIRALAEGLIGAGSAHIGANIETLENLVITEEVYGEFTEAARVTGDIVMKSLRLALDERVEFEKGQATLVAEKAAMAEEQAKLRADQKKLADAQAAVEASERAAKAAEEAEAQRKADVKAALQAKTDAIEADKKRAGYLEKRLPQDKLAREYASRLFVVAATAQVLDDGSLASLVAATTRAVMNAAQELKDSCQGGESS